MNARDRSVLIEARHNGRVVRARHPELPGHWGEGPDERSARSALGVAIRLAARGSVEVAPDDPITVRYDHDGLLDEVLGHRAIHLERIADDTFYLGVGDLQVTLTIEGGRLVATLEASSERLVVEPAYGLEPGERIPPRALAGMEPDRAAS